MWAVKLISFQRQDMKLLYKKNDMRVLSPLKEIDKKAKI